MNKVILIGRLTRDPEMRYTQGDNGMAIARFNLAVDRRRANADGQRDADFISCVAFGHSAEFAGKWLHQGTKIALTGRIQTGNYTNKDGQKVYTTDVVAEELEFAESKAAEDLRISGGAGYNGGGTNRSSSRQGSGSYAKASGPDTSSPGGSFGDGSLAAEGFMNIPEDTEDEGLPFN